MNHEAEDCPFDELAGRLCRAGVDHDHSVNPENVGTQRCPYAWRHRIKSRALRKLAAAYERSQET